MSTTKTANQLAVGDKITKINPPPTSSTLTKDISQILNTTQKPKGKSESSSSSSTTKSANSESSGLKSILKKISQIILSVFGYIKEYWIIFGC